MNDPKSLINPDKLIISTRKYYSAYHKSKWSSPDISLPHLDINVSEPQLSRALIFMDLLIKALNNKGYGLIVEQRETFIIVDNQKNKVALREKTKVIQTDSNSWTRTNEPTGIFIFKVGTWDKKEWADSNLNIEEKLQDIILFIERKAETEKQSEIESKKRRDEYESQKAIKLAFEQKRKDDLLSFKNDLEKSERWHKTNNLRDYINEVELRAKANDSYTNELRAHLERLKQQADWYDPFLNTSDELLDAVKKETLEVPKSEFSW